MPPPSQINNTLCTNNTPENNTTMAGRTGGGGGGAVRGVEVLERMARPELSSACLPLGRSTVLPRGASGDDNPARTAENYISLQPPAETALRFQDLELGSQVRGQGSQGGGTLQSHRSAPAVRGARRLC